MLIPISDHMRSMLFSVSSLAKNSIRSGQRQSKDAQPFGSAWRPRSGQAPQAFGRCVAGIGRERTGRDTNSASASPNPPAPVGSCANGGLEGGWRPWRPPGPVRERPAFPIHAAVPNGPRPSREERGGRSLNPNRGPFSAFAIRARAWRAATQRLRQKTYRRQLSAPVHKFV